MELRFGAALNHFASAVDIVDEGIVDDVNKLLKNYLGSQLQFDFYEILVEEWLESGGARERGLRTFRVHGGKTFGTSSVGDGSDNQTAYCYVREIPLWITAEDEGKLVDAERYVDAWGDKRVVDDLPHYEPGNRYPVRTSIMQPLQDESGTFGVLNLESTHCLVANQFARDDLSLVADAVASIMLRYRAQKAIREGTKQAISELSPFVASSRWTVTHRPKIFIASSERADVSVTGALQEVAGQIEGYEVRYWADEKEGGTGDVRQDMLRDLREARAVICYLSELPPGSEKYVDNPNVLFEAGIAEGLRAIWRDFLLIPVREAQGRCAARLPKDLEPLRAVVVPRDSSGALNVNALKSALRPRLSWDRLRT